MRLVIDILNNEYELVRHGNKSPLTELELMNAVVNGTPLPEHHGRLIDAMKLKTSIFSLTITNSAFDRGLDAAVECINNAPTIIEGGKR